MTNTTHDRIALAEGAHVDLEVAGFTIRVTHVVDDAHAIQLGGVDCDLDGEQPGLYFPVARGAGEWPGALRAD